VANVDKQSLAVAGVPWAFTGFRLVECGQAKLAKGRCYNVVPSPLDAGEWAGSSLAFIHADLTFYDSHNCQVTSAMLFSMMPESAP
jgi:hypothetical protein